MKLDVELWIKSDTHRHYLTNDLELTSSTSPVSWFRRETPEVLNLSEQEEDIAVGIFSINAISAATLWPRGLEIEVDDASQWDEVQPAVLSLLSHIAGADEINIFPSSQNPDQY